MTYIVYICLNIYCLVSKGLLCLVTSQPSIHPFLLNSPCPSLSQGCWSLPSSHWETGGNKLECSVIRDDANENEEAYCKPQTMTLNFPSNFSFLQLTSSQLQNQIIVINMIDSGSCVIVQVSPLDGNMSFITSHLSCRVFKSKLMVQQQSRGAPTSLKLFSVVFKPVDLSCFVCAVDGKSHTPHSPSNHLICMYNICTRAMSTHLTVHNENCQNSPLLLCDSVTLTPLS